MKTYREIAQEIETALGHFSIGYHLSVNRIILSRNYVDIIKQEYLLYDIELDDCELKYDGIQVIVDECTTDRIGVGFMLNY